MKKHILTFFFYWILFSCFSQIDSLRIGDSYWEDQLYLNITYNVLNNQPSGVTASEFSFGVSFGYIKDIPFSKSGKFGIGVGIGYNYDFFTHSLLVNETSFFINSSASSNTIKLHNLEFPVQIRWRSSDAITYSFWRVYTGIKFSYNLKNNFSYTLEDVDYSFSNIDAYNNFQTGLEISVGYGAFNFYVYYGLDSMFKKVTLLDSEKINTTVSRFGFVFYIL